MLINDLGEKLEAEGLQIISNNYDDIFALYSSNIEFAKLSKAYPVRMESVIEDAEDIPPFTDEEHKHFISICNVNQELVAVVDIIEGYSFQEKNNPQCIWVGLLEVDGNKHQRGIGSRIVHSLIAACKDNNIATVQLGVIQKNEGAFEFWTKAGFKTFTEKNNGDHDLFLMEKKL